MTLCAKRSCLARVLYRGLAILSSQIVFVGVKVEYPLLVFSNNSMPETNIRGIFEQMSAGVDLSLLLSRSHFVRNFSPTPVHEFDLMEMANVGGLGRAELC